MKRKTVRFLALLLSMLAVVTLASACKDDTEQPPAQEPEDDSASTTQSEGKEIDIYFIAGQSNAAGHTPIKDANAIYEAYPALKDGTPNILYAGNAKGNEPNNTATHNWGSVKLGLGHTANHMGPEVGMAYALSAYYNTRTGKEAGIIKFAHGGTGLAKTGGSGSNAAGDWSPPSYTTWQENDETNGYIGGLYRGFMDEAELRIRQLKEMGYTKINIKGLYWMQGCNDTWRYQSDSFAYPRAFACLVSDLRGDLSDMMKMLKLSGSGAENMPFFIGTISRSYRLDTGVQATNARNLPFIEMQKQLAENNTNCYIVDNSVYDVMVWDEVANQAVVVGADSAHWGQADCFTIGKNVGNMILENCTSYQKTPGSG